MKARRVVSGEEKRIRDVERVRKTKKRMGIT